MEGGRDGQTYRQADKKRDNFSRLIKHPFWWTWGWLTPGKERERERGGGGGGAKMIENRWLLHANGSDHILPSKTTTKSASDKHRDTQEISCSQYLICTCPDAWSAHLWSAQVGATIAVLIILLRWLFNVVAHQLSDLLMTFFISSNNVGNTAEIAVPITVNLSGSCGRWEGVELGVQDTTWGTRFLLEH